MFTVRTKVNMVDSQDIDGVDFFPPNLISQICISILDEVLEQLLILKTINNWPEVGQIDATYKTIEERFSKDAPQITQSSSDEVLNFKRKCAYILAIVKTTVEELKKSGSCNQLLDIIKVFKIMQSDEEKLIEDTLNKEGELRNLNLVFEEDKQFYHRKFQETMADIGRIKDEITDFKLESEIKLNYVRNWQNSKVEMTETLLSKNEQQKIDRLKKLDSDVYRETRVHEEILAAYAEIQKDLECQIDEWKEKYDSHRKDLDTKINTLKEEREKLRNARAKLEERYSIRKTDIDSFKQYRIKQQEIRLDLERRNRTATNIQAWWRGIMVRKGFGKFRKKKDKKAKKKSSELKTKT